MPTTGRPTVRAVAAGERARAYDWHARHSETRFRMVGQIRLSPAVQAGVALHRVRTVGRYEPRDLDRFVFLRSHLQRALEIAFRLGALGAIQQCTAELLDRNPAAILLLDEHKRIVYTNQAAEALRSASDGVVLSPRGILLARKHDQDRLEALIAGLLSAVAPSGSAGGVMRAQRPSGKPPYAIVVAPLPRRYPALCAVRPALCVFISDPEANRLVPAGRLEAAFDLTAAEARLAALLAAGDDLRAAAAKLRITYGTARARLAQIFQKTETRRQAELVRLLLATVAIG